MAIASLLGPGGGSQSGRTLRGYGGLGLELERAAVERDQRGN